MEQGERTMYTTLYICTHVHGHNVDSMI